MTRTSRKLVLLFLLLILLPVALLTWRSVESLRDERESVQAEERLLAGPLQDALERSLNSLTQGIAYADPRSLDLAVYESFAEVEQAFRVDAAGRLTYPLFAPLTLGQRRPAFDAIMTQAEELELREHSYPAARDAYRQAWKNAASGAEEAEALNALGRAALAAGDLGTAAEAHRRLTLYGLTFDADGAHPATLSHLRLAEYLGASQGQAVLADWARALLEGRYPLYPGVRQALASARGLIAAWPSEDAGDRALLADLDRAERRLAFAERFVDLLRERLPRQTGYVSGLRPNGASFLLYARQLADGETIGLSFDLEQLQQALVRSTAGERLAQRGFDLALFAREGRGAFAGSHRATIYRMVPAGEWLAGLQLGIFATDAASVVSYYRKRNLAVLSGIFLLVGFVALGGYVMLRDTHREVRLARLRSEFVANVSHELRTPLAAIRMNAETLLAGRYRTPEKRDEFLRSVIRESDRLTRLVDNILAFAQLDSGRQTYDLQPCDLAGVVRAALEPLEPQLQRRGFTLEVEIADDLPPLRGDRGALIIAATNLLANAAKYSVERLELRVTVAAQGEDQVLEVADRGIGVPPAERERIFEKFYRASNATACIATGAGVGLALTRSIAEAHGGRVELEARPGGGSLFRLVLPAEKS
ncbi:MAG: HAMP domain-containing sensor histidine kinase [Candidatus Latescibacterota bacterium]|jgi:signal transduction histidine kinase